MFALTLSVACTFIFVHFQADMGQSFQLYRQNADCISEAEEYLGNATTVVQCYDLCVARRGINGCEHIKFGKPTAAQPEVRCYYEKSCDAVIDSTEFDAYFFEAAHYLFEANARCSSVDSFLIDTGTDATSCHDLCLVSRPSTECEFIAVGSGDCYAQQSCSPTVADDNYDVYRFETLQYNYAVNSQCDDSTAESNVFLSESVADALSCYAACMEAQTPSDMCRWVTFGSDGSCKAGSQCTVVGNGNSGGVSSDVYLFVPRKISPRVQLSDCAFAVEAPAVVKVQSNQNIGQITLADRVQIEFDFLLKSDCTATTCSLLSIDTTGVHSMTGATFTSPAIYVDGNLDYLWAIFSCSDSMQCESTIFPWKVVVDNEWHHFYGEWSDFQSRVEIDGVHRTATYGNFTSIFRDSYPIFVGDARFTALDADVINLCVTSSPMNLLDESTATIFSMDAANADATSMQIDFVQDQQSSKIVYEDNFITKHKRCDSVGSFDAVCFDPISECIPIDLDIRSSACSSLTMEFAAFQLSSDGSDLHSHSRVMAIDSTNFDRGFYLNGNGIQMGVGYDSASAGHTHTPLLDYQWSHIVGVWDDSGMAHLYVDGVSTLSASISRISDPVPNMLADFCLASHWHGCFARANIYPFALNDSGVSALYKQFEDALQSDASPEEVCSVDDSVVDAVAVNLPPVNVPVVRRRLQTGDPLWDIMSLVFPDITSKLDNEAKCDLGTLSYVRPAGTFPPYCESHVPDRYGAFCYSICPDDYVSYYLPDPIPRCVAQCAPDHYDDPTQTSCIKDAVGRVLDVYSPESHAPYCDSGRYMETNVCWNYCVSGYYAALTTCWQYCASGYVDMGWYCERCSWCSYWVDLWIGGYWQDYPCCDSYNKGVYDRGVAIAPMVCNAGYGYQWLYCYAWCVGGYHETGVGECTEDCPTSVFIGPLCQVSSLSVYVKHVIVKTVSLPWVCEAGKTLESGLCYVDCVAPFVGVLDVCWNTWMLQTGVQLIIASALSQPTMIVCMPYFVAFMGQFMVTLAATPFGDASLAEFLLMGPTAFPLAVCLTPIITLLEQFNAYDDDASQSWSLNSLTLAVEFGVDATARGIITTGAYFGIAMVVDLADPGSIDMHYYYGVSHGLDLGTFEPNIGGSATLVLYRSLADISGIASYLGASFDVPDVPLDPGFALAFNGNCHLIALAFTTSIGTETQISVPVSISMGFAFSADTEPIGTLTIGRRRLQALQKQIQIDVNEDGKRAQVQAQARRKLLASDSIGDDCLANNVVVSRYSPVCREALALTYSTTPDWQQIGLQCVMAHDECIGVTVDMHEGRVRILQLSGCSTNGIHFYSPERNVNEEFYLNSCLEETRALAAPAGNPGMLEFVHAPTMIEPNKVVTGRSTSQYFAKCPFTVEADIELTGMGNAGVVDSEWSNIIAFMDNEQKLYPALFVNLEFQFQLRVGERFSCTSEAQSENAAILNHERLTFRAAVNCDGVSQLFLNDVLLCSTSAGTAKDANLPLFDLRECDAEAVTLFASHPMFPSADGTIYSLRATLPKYLWSGAVPQVPFTAGETIGTPAGVDYILTPDTLVFPYLDMRPPYTVSFDLLIRKSDEIIMEVLESGELVEYDLRQISNIFKLGVNNLQDPDVNEIVLDYQSGDTGAGLFLLVTVGDSDRECYERNEYFRVNEWNNIQVFVESMNVTLIVNGLESCWVDIHESSLVMNAEQPLVPLFFGLSERSHAVRALYRNVRAVMNSATAQLSLPQLLPQHLHSRPQQPQQVQQPQRPQPQPQPPQTQPLGNNNYNRELEMTPETAMALFAAALVLGAALMWCMFKLRCCSIQRKTTAYYESVAGNSARTIVSATTGIATN
jgi:hypothetical protein